MLGVKRGVVGLVAVLVAATAVACSTSDGDNANPPPETRSPWQQTLDQIRPDGTVDTTTAVRAFAQAVAPLPGVKAPGPGEDIQSGTIAIRWVFAHWADLTDEQRSAVYTALAGAAPGAAPAGGQQKKPIPPDIPCQVKDSPKAERYRTILHDVIGDINSHLPQRDWQRYNQPTTIVLGGTRGGPTALATSVGCVGTTPTNGTATGCTIHLGKLIAKSSAAAVRDALVHEVMHCVMNREFGVLKAADMAQWYAEGFPAWVQIQLGRGKSPVAIESWHNYVGSIDDEKNGAMLMQMSYEGMGFFVHLAETGTSPWDVAYAIGAAMTGASNGNKTQAGWEAAKVTDAFLNTWGSGFAQGRYPGRAWKTTGPHLDDYSRYQKQPKPLRDGSAVPVKSAHTAPELAPLDVSAEVVQVVPEGKVYGRISLGGGKEATLNVATTQIYCTLDPAKCRCPSDSARADTQFTPINKGTVYVGLTGGLDQANLTVAGMSLKDFCGNKKPSCLVGTWTSTEITAEVARPDGGLLQTSNGGAGVQLTIDRGGAVTVNYTGMKQVDAAVTRPPQLGYTTWRGTQHGTIELPDGKAKSGEWHGQDGGDDVMVHNVVTAPIITGDTQPLQKWLSIGRTPGLVSPMNDGTWSCDGTTLTLTLTFTINPAATGKWVLSR